MDENKKFLDILKADNLGRVPDSVGTIDDQDKYLPKEIANKIVTQLIEENFIRRMFPTVTVPKNVRNLTVPAINYGANNVRVIGYGEDVTSGSETSFSTKSVVLQPRLLVTYVDMIEDDLQSAGVDTARIIRETLTKKLAEAEERAEMFGVFNASSGVYSNIFNGIYTIAAGSSCATSPITYGTSDNKAFKVMKAIKAMGVYGRDARNMVLLCSTTFGLALRQTDVIYNQSYRRDTDVLKSGTLPPIAGVTVIESTHLDEKESGEVAILIRKDAFLIGQRESVFFRTDDIVEKFSKRLIIAEEVDFKPQLLNASDKYEGICLIHFSS